jgi:chromosome segregation ATPase
LQGLILSNALRAQKDAEDEGCVMALSNLRSEVIELRNEGLEKDKILHSLINRIKEDEATFKVQAEAQRSEIEDLRKQLARAKEERTLEETKREISEQWANHLEKSVEELRASKKRCYEKSVECVKKVKTSFASVGAFSSEENFPSDEAEVPDLSASRDNSDLSEDDPCDPTTTSKPEAPMQSLNQLPVVTDLADARSA